MTTQVTRDNHYVPQMYLRRWSNNGNTVHCYSTIVSSEHQPVWRSASIKTTAYWRDFYSQRVDNRIDDSIEVLFGEKYETPAAAAFEKLDVEAHLDKEDLASLVDFAILQMVRVPAWYAKVCTMAPDIFEPVVRTTVRSTLERYRTHGVSALGPKSAGREAAKPSVFPVFDVQVEIDGAQGEIASSMSIDRAYYLACVGRILEGEVGNAMRRYDWSVVKLPTGVSVPTSDNPFVRLAHAKDGRLTLDASVGDYGALLFMPLTPRHLLMTLVGGGVDLQDWVEDGDAVTLLTEAIVRNATRYVYDNRERDDLVQIRPPRVDRQYDTNMRELMDNWDSYQTGDVPE